MKYAVNKGFTIIELMIVVAILGMISAIAIPTYQDYLLRSNRKVAVADMFSIQQALERQYNIDNGAYILSNLPFPAGGVGSCNTVSRLTSGDPPNYILRVTIENNGQSYQIDAEPCSGQTGEECGVLTLNSDGSTSSTLGDNCF